MIEFIFSFCDIFNDVDNISTIRWLKKFKHEMFDYKQANKIISSTTYLNTINMLFTNEATDWFENYSNAIRLLTESIFT